MTDKTTEKRPLSRTLLDFLIPKKPKNELLSFSPSSSSLLPTPTDMNLRSTTPKLVPDAEITAPDPTASTLTNYDSQANDIGVALLSPLNDGIKKKLLTNPISLPSNDKFPFSEHRKNNKLVKCYLRKHHLEAFPWLSYSPFSKGVYCKYCSLFAPSNVGVSKCSTEVGYLVKKPLTNFSKLVGKDGALSKHDNARYHKDAIGAAQDFLRTFAEPEKVIVNMLNDGRLKQIMENRSRLLPIIDTIITLGRQNIPLRGHRDDGALLNLPDSGTIVNEGNFREILKLRVRAGDTSLKKHLESCGQKATYISKTTQNELIQICGDLITEKIVSRVETNNFYSIIFDETTDISHRSQLALIIRYKFNQQIREDFISFIDVHEVLFTNKSQEPKITGSLLGQAVIALMQNKNLNISNCVGICTDTCNLMVGEQKGAVNEILKHATNAIHTRCYSHSLNLSLSRTINVQSLRNCFGNIKEIISFFNSSAKRNFTLKQKLNSQLHSLCETRWVQRHESLLIFEKGLEHIISALETISTWDDIKCSSKAECFLNMLLNTTFIVSLKSLIFVFQITYRLSVYLQNENIQTCEATELISNVKKILNSRRENAETHFHNVWKEVEHFLSIYDLTPTMPRIVAKQTKRPNPSSCTSPEEYFRISIFIPMLDFVINDFDTRFNSTSIELALFSLIPGKLKKMDLSLSELTHILWEKYSSLLLLRMPHGHFLDINVFMQEIELWRLECISHDVTDAMAALDVSKDKYPNIHTLLTIFCSLPVTTSSAERSFSTLKRLKTWLRGNMSEKRLVGLALLNCHPDINLEPEEVLDRFAKNKSRKSDFVL